MVDQLRVMPPQLKQKVEIAKVMQSEPNALVKKRKNEVPAKMKQNKQFNKSHSTSVLTDKPEFKKKKLKNKIAALDMAAHTEVPRLKKKKKNKQMVVASEEVRVVNKPMPVKQEPVIPERAKKLKEKEKILSKVAETKFPILKDTELIRKVMSVGMTNNQKGRIRQSIKNTLEGTDKSILPYIINNHIQNIIRQGHLGDAQLRKIRVLFNMLKTAVKDLVDKETTAAARVDAQAQPNKKVENKRDKVEKPEVTAEGDAGRMKTKPKTLEDITKEKKPSKRYVVFVGNLPKKVTKEMIIEHFSLLKDYIKSVRIPHPKENSRSSIAYVEFTSQPSFEMALSKHHSMLGNRRINVLYTTQKDSNMSKAEAKAKRAKLVAMVKAGKLPGSVPLTKKRSHRRMKAKKAAQVTKS